MLFLAGKIQRGCTWGQCNWMSRKGLSTFTGVAGASSARAARVLRYCLFQLCGDVFFARNGRNRSHCWNFGWRSFPASKISISGPGSSVGESILICQVCRFGPRSRHIKNQLVNTSVSGTMNQCVFLFSLSQVKK